MTYKWQDKNITSYYYEVKTGKIVANISRTNFSDDVWHAEINTDNYGQFISAEHAMKAVEQKVKELDKEAKELRKSMPKMVLYT